MTYFTFEVLQIIRETPDVRSFVLSPDQPFTYKPGQFLTIVRGNVRRSFSFSSHPSDPFPRITLKRIPNGEISRWLFDEIEVGDSFEGIEASGLFTLPDDLRHVKSIVFFAAGTGITPILPLMREALSRNVKVSLVYSTRSVNEMLFKEEIEKLDIKLDVYMSNRKELQLARLNRSGIEKVARENDPSKTLYYLCGPHVYMQNISITLLTEGIPDDNIRREIFFNPEPPVVNIPPDTDMHTVTVRYEGKVHNLKVQFPKSILQTAKQQGIILPYSCEAGRCGTCAATCTSGEIWMLRNEVLLDKEMARGRVLTCTGYAVGGDADVTITG